MWLNYPSEYITMYNDHSTGLYNAWEELQKYLEKSRYFINHDLKIFQLVDSITDTSINLSSLLYRARINERIQNGGEGKYKQHEMEAPPADKCKVGRLNPLGIPYLYLSDSKETCVAETRPWIGSEVEVADFIPTKELLIKDFTIQEKDNGEMERLKKLFSYMLSKPISSTNSEKEYIITQCIAEYIKIHSKNEEGRSFDGIKYYSSANSGGYNIAIFNPTNMQLRKIIGRAIIGNIRVEF